MVVRSKLYLTSKQASPLPVLWLFYCVLLGVLFRVSSTIDISDTIESTAHAIQVAEQFITQLELAGKAFIGPSLTQNVSLMGHFLSGFANIPKCVKCGFLKPESKQCSVFLVVRYVRKINLLLLSHIRGHIWMCPQTMRLEASLMGRPLQLLYLFPIFWWT